MYSCMYVCLHVSVFACLYLYVCAYDDPICIRILYVDLYEIVYVRPPVCVYMCMYVCMRMYVCMCQSTHCVFECVFI